MTVEGLVCTVTILQGQGLVAKDRNLLGKKTSSDPYVEVRRRGKVVGRTPTQKKTLNPQWTTGNRFRVEFDNLTYASSLSLNIFDEDMLSSPDSMGVLSLPLDPKTSNTTQWYNVPKSSAKNASGKLQIQLEIRLIHSRSLIRGNEFELSASKIQVGLAWDMIRGKNVDLDVSCVAIHHNGQVALEDCVYYANTNNSNKSVVHSGDEQEGDKDGDDETITFRLTKVPSKVLAMYITLTVVTPNMRIPDIQSTKLSIYALEHNHHKRVLCRFTPASHSLSANATAMFMVRIAREEPHSPKWVCSPIEDTHPTARDFGSLLPHLKSYTRDLIPDLKVDPSERVAILRKGGNIRLTDYVANGKLPEVVTFGLAWDVTAGVDIDLDASVICLDANLRLRDMVWWKQLRSKDSAIKHHGDEREGDKVGDDEKIDINLPMVDPKVEYIGLIINSFSGQELDDIDRAACHLFDPITGTDMASYALTNSKNLDGYQALVMACLYRSGHPGEWCLCIISEGAHGRVVKDNVDELQQYLKRNPPIPPGERPVESVRVQMPSYLPLVPVEEHAATIAVATTAQLAPPAGIPQKFIKVNGVTKLNPDYKKWKAAQN